MFAIMVKAELQIEKMKMMFYNSLAINKKLWSVFPIMYLSQKVKLMSEEEDIELDFTVPFQAL